MNAALLRPTPPQSVGTRNTMHDRPLPRPVGRRGHGAPRHGRREPPPEGFPSARRLSELKLSAGPLFRATMVDQADAGRAWSWPQLAGRPDGAPGAAMMIPGVPR